MTFLFENLDSLYEVLKSGVERWLDWTVILKCALQITQIQMISGVRGCQRVFMNWTKVTIFSGCLTRQEVQLLFQGNTSAFLSRRKQEKGFPTAWNLSLTSCCLLPRSSPGRQKQSRASHSGFPVTVFCLQTPSASSSASSHCELQ